MALFTHLEDTLAQATALVADLQGNHKRLYSAELKSDPTVPVQFIGYANDVDGEPVTAVFMDNTGMRTMSKSLFDAEYEVFYDRD